MNQLVVLEQLKPLEVFTPQGVDDILDRIIKQARSEVTDISTAKGRDQIKSLAHTIARSKTYLDEMGKELVAEQKKQLALVDAERKRIRDRLDALKEEIRAPLTEWENREEERVKGHESALLGFDALSKFDMPHPASAEVEQRFKLVLELHDRDWEEFAKRAELGRDAAIKKLHDILTASKKYEDEQAELVRLRLEKEEREKRERDERIAADAAAKAKAEAEAAAKAEADKAEAARLEAARKAKEEADAAAAREERLKREREEADARAKKAEADRVAAEEKAKAAAEKAERDRKEAADAAAKAERDRIEREQKEEADAAAKREADKKHRTKVNNEALNGLVTHCNSETVDVTPEIAKAVVEAIAKGLIPHVKISY